MDEYKNLRHFMCRRFLAAVCRSFLQWFFLLFLMIRCDMIRTEIVFSAQQRKQQITARADDSVKIESVYKLFMRMNKQEDDYG